jgi:NADPH:quinone reductase-like Zn-dependent oxidoreductase
VKAVVVTRNGGPEVLEVRELPDPVPGEGELLIRVAAAGINFADLMARTGVYPDAPPLPSVLGYEVAGTVVEAGPGVDGYARGDRVAAGCKFRGQAELVTARAADTLKLPDTISFDEAAAIPVNYATAYAALVIMCGLRRGDRVLIHAAAGGVGIAAIQIARNLGAEIYGTASAPKHDAIRAQGVTHAIDYRSVDFAQEVLRLTGGEGVDVIIDATGPTSYRKDYRILRQGGRLVMFGLAEAHTGDRRNLRAVVSSLVRMPFATMPWWKSLAMMNENRGVFGLNMLHWWEREGSLKRAIDPIAQMLDAGSIRPVVAASFPFSRAADAHRYLQEARNIGKVVLVPD